MIRIWHADVRETTDGIFLDLSDLLDDLDWKDGDTLVFIKKEDGSILIQKKTNPT